MSQKTIEQLQAEADALVVKQTQQRRRQAEVRRASRQRRADKAAESWDAESANIVRRAQRRFTGKVAG